MSICADVQAAIDQIDALVVALAPVPNGCACRWTALTGRRLRRLNQEVVASVCGLATILEEVEAELDEPLAALRTAQRLLEALPPAARVGPVARYTAYVNA